MARNSLKGVFRELFFVVLTGLALGAAADAAVPGGVLRDWKTLLRDVDVLVPVQRLSARRVKDLLAHEEIVVVDGRSVMAYRSRHPQGALQILFADPDPGLMRHASRVAGKAVLVIAETHQAVQARDLAQRLVREAGAREAATLIGGWEGWCEEGLPVSEGQEGL